MHLHTIRWTLRNRCDEDISSLIAGIELTKVTGVQVALGVLSFLVGDLCKYPVPPRSCPRDLATTDLTGDSRLSAYDTRGQLSWDTYTYVRAQGTCN
jgi:hypothetical protein